VKELLNSEESGGIADPPVIRVMVLHTKVESIGGGIAIRTLLVLGLQVLMHVVLFKLELGHIDRLG